MRALWKIDLTAKHPTPRKISKTRSFMDNFKDLKRVCFWKCAQMPQKPLPTVYNLFSFIIESCFLLLKHVSLSKRIRRQFKYLINISSVVIWVYLSMHVHIVVCFHRFTIECGSLHLEYKQYTDPLHWQFQILGC